MTPAVETQVAAVAAHLANALPAASLLLTGAAARDEVAEAVIAGRHEVFSDYQFFVVPPRHLRVRRRAAILDGVRQMAATFGYRNPLFHVDIAFRARGRLHRLPRDMFTFELQQHARLLHGVDVRPLIPAVSPTTLDLRATNEVLLDSVWKMLRLLPAAFVHARGRMPEEMVELAAAYLIARTALDLPAALLPRQGVLLSTYGERVTWVERHGLAPWPAPEAVALREFLRSCFDARCCLRFFTAARMLYPQLLAYLRRAFDVIGVDAPTSPFRERPTSRGGWWVLMRSALRIAQAQGGGAAYRWVRLPRKQLQARAHLALHDALAAFVHGDEARAEASLQQAWRPLADLFPGTEPVPPPGAFAERWVATRTRWDRYWRRFCLLA